MLCFRAVCARTTCSCCVFVLFVLVQLARAVCARADPVHVVYTCVADCLTTCEHMVCLCFFLVLINCDRVVRDRAESSCSCRVVLVLLARRTGRDHACSCCLFSRVVVLLARDVCSHTACPCCLHS